jgi:SNF2 family DNA or RNA helicase
MPGYLANLINFQRKYNIKDVTDKDLESLKHLEEQIRPFILRRKKKDVVQELPDKIENNVFIDLNKEQKKLYVAQLEKTKKEMDDIIRNEGFKKGNFKILQLLTKLRQLCIDPRILYEEYKGGSAKIENLVQIVKDTVENGHKILLFTSYKTALDIVNAELTNNNISTYVIDGSVSSKKRMELVDKFNTDDTNVFLITLKAGGTGLNLTSADVVIHLDLWWNPQVENQATDRAHRIGQKNTVEVIKLICKGTIEERILELQTKKKVLSDTLIEGEDRDQNIISKLTEEDIQNLLSLDNDEDK